jgi:hypothetical protein
MVKYVICSSKTLSLRRSAIVLLISKIASRSNRVHSSLSLVSAHRLYWFKFFDIDNA